MTASAGKVKIVAKVTIAASPSMVFEYLTNLGYHFLWNPHLQKVSPLMILKKNSSYESASIILGIKVRGMNKATMLIPDRELQLENQTGLIHYNVNYRLRAQPRHTTLTCTTTVDTDYKPLHFAEPIMRTLARRELQSDLQALKVAVEQQIR